LQVDQFLAFFSAAIELDAQVSELIFKLGHFTFAAGDVAVEVAAQQSD
jgi:hypothetical protein